MSDALDSLLASGSPSAKFPTIGTVVKGEIVKVEEQQQRDFSTNELKYWDNGDPMMQFAITLMTAERDPNNDDDDGERRIFAKGQMRQAITAAIKASGAEKDQVIGGILAVQYARDGEPSKRGFNPPKEYVAQFQPATKVAPANLIDSQPPAATPPAEQPAQVQAQPTASSLI